MPRRQLGPTHGASPSRPVLSCPVLPFPVLCQPQATPDLPHVPAACFSRTMCPFCCLPPQPWPPSPRPSFRQRPWTRTCRRRCRHCGRPSLPRPSPTPTQASPSSFPPTRRVCRQHNRYRCTGNRVSLALPTTGPAVRLQPSSPVILILGSRLLPPTLLPIPVVRSSLPVQAFQETLKKMGSASKQEMANALNTILSYHTTTAPITAAVSGRRWQQTPSPKLARATTRLFDCWYQLVTGCALWWAPVEAVKWCDAAEAVFIACLCCFFSWPGRRRTDRTWLPTWRAPS